MGIPVLIGWISSVFSRKATSKLIQFKKYLKVYYMDFDGVDVNNSFLFINFANKVC